MSVSRGKEEALPASKRLYEELGADKSNISPIQPGRSSSPVPSCVSMKSDTSMTRPIMFTDDPDTKEGPIQTGRSSSPVPSCVSMKSDTSMTRPIMFTDDPDTKDIDTACNPKDQSSMEKLVEENIMTFVKNEMAKYNRILNPALQGDFGSQREDAMLNTEGGTQESLAQAQEGALRIVLHILKKINQTKLAIHLENSLSGPLVVCQRKIKTCLENKCQYVFEGIAMQGNHTLLNKVYTEVYITEGWSGEVNQEHEVMQIETAARRPATQEIPIECNDIFKSSAFTETTRKDKTPIRIVMTKGVAGIGKTFSVQKFSLDWVSGKANQEVQLIFYLPFRELNANKGENYSLIELLHHFFIEVKESGITDFEKFKVLFIFDGLDECRIPLDFQNNVTVCDATESTSLDVLITNLIKGNLLSTALIWITSRPAAANQIPSEYIHRVTEVRGFSDTKKEEYFLNKINNKELARRFIKHMKSTRSLQIMCHIPVFSCITASVVETHFDKTKSEEMPKTLTEIYTHFLICTAQRKKTFSGGPGEAVAGSQKHRDEDMIMKLGKLAFEQLIKGHLIFYEEDLRECGIDVKEAAVFSGLCTQIFRKELGLCNVYCFVHLSMQEFLAALFVFYTFSKHNVNLLDNQTTTGKQTPEGRSTAILHKSAVKKALQSKNGHLDLFLRFLLGLSLESNQTLLRGLLTTTRSATKTNQETVSYIKERIRENASPERCINLFHCLNELHDQSLVGEIQSFLSSGSLCKEQLSPTQWAALVYVLLTSEEDLDVFELGKYIKSNEGLMKLLPVVKASKKALLNDCNLTGRCCESLASSLSSNSSYLTEIDLSTNNLQNLGVRQLCAGLKNPLCKVTKLSLKQCHLTNTKALASVIGLKSSSIKDLDLSDNDLQDSGVKQLADGLCNTDCELKVLRLRLCGITWEGCGFLESALKSNPFHLRELDLTYNHPGVIGKKLLSTLLTNPDSKLQTLSLDHDSQCYLRSALKKYNIELTPDTNTAHDLLSLTEGNKKVVHQQNHWNSYPDHPERFDHWTQVVCAEAQTGSCYWEAEWEGYGAYVGMAYRRLGRKGGNNNCVIGYNDMSWSLHCTDQCYDAYHNVKNTSIQLPLTPSHKVGVYLDWEGGTLSFYSVTPDFLSHLHTFKSKFTEPLYAVLWPWPDSAITLCQLQDPPVRRSTEEIPM